MNRARFEALVRRSLAEIPDEFRRHLESVAIVVQERPTPEQLRQWELDPDDADLLGFYDGVPLTEGEDDAVVPRNDAIYVFQRAHEEMCASESELVDEIRRTVIHEVGHHFGLDDDRIDELGFG
jgi:predicted Zn-dependent protease with MMP-like domain